MTQEKELLDIKSVAIKIASPEEILSWSHGEVLKPETINYRTQRPEKDGLFSERIFGPTRDYECYCGKYKKIRYKDIVCEKCGVKVTRSSVRREWMGHISLAAPVAHIWFLRTIPSRLSLILDISLPKLERVVYYASYIVTEINEEKREKALKELKKDISKFEKETKDKKIEEIEKRVKDFLVNLKIGTVLEENEYFYWAAHYGEMFLAERGAEAIKKILENLNLKKIADDLKAEMSQIKDQSRFLRLSKRLRLINNFLKNNIRPEWMILTVLPVLPPDLRPMVALDGGRYATADLNDLYRRVINRNNRLKKLIELKSPEIIIVNEKRMLQEAVDALIDNTINLSNQILSSRRRPLKSLADNLKGKQGRFRQNLLGKRVDYSGRSVIVVGPELKINECGLPKILALELFRPFVINKVIERGYAYNIKTANRFIEQGSAEVWAILEEVIQNKKVLLNRAPTLHRLSIQAFTPKLIEDLAIRIPPLVCTAFNADFDGDQMAVHLPLTLEAQYEAHEIMDASKNILKPANGEPIATPSQDMVLGCYFLTREITGLKGEGKVFADEREVMYAYENGLIDINSKIKVFIKKEGKLIETTYGRIIFNEIFKDDFRFVNEVLNKKQLSKLIAEIIKKYGIEESYIYLDKIKSLGFKYSTLSAFTWSMADLITPSEKKKIIKEAEKEVLDIAQQFEDGYLTVEERKVRIINIWEKVRSEITKLSSNILSKDNPIYNIIDSGARGSWGQLVQMVGLKGLVQGPKNEAIELPIKNSYKDGLTTLEYFISTHGSRKGITDTALKTAHAGYLTRRLVDVAQDLIIKEEDCQTKEGLKIRKSDVEDMVGFGYTFSSRIVGRISLQDVKIKNKIVVAKNQLITEEIAKVLEASEEVEEIVVRSPLTCKTLYGICSKCFGVDLTKNKLIEVGEAIGIIAAQSIGEPGTQLTLRTFHLGGVSGVDITHGLPRVEEIFEARVPKGKAPLVSDDGVVTKIENKDTFILIKVKSEKSSKKKNKVNEKDYLVSKKAKLLVKEGDVVKRGDKLVEGPMDLREVLAYRGIDELRNYIIKEIQKVYFPVGSVINDRYIEVIVRQMFSRVQIKDPGDSDFIEGQIVDKSTFLKVNEEIKKLKGKPAKAIQKVIGIKKVALTTESFLSAASFQETSRVLVEAATEGKIDYLRGLKENVIIGKLIPAGTGLKDLSFLKKNLTNEENNVNL